MSDIQNNFTVSEYSGTFPILKIIGIPDFDQEDIFECGQCFRWDRISFNRDKYLNSVGKDGGDFLPPDGTPGYITTAFGKCIQVFQHGNVVYLFNADKESFEKIWHEYFDLSRDYGLIKQELSLIDDKMKAATEISPGLRILRQDFFETMISFIVSANNNIPRIKKIISNICLMAGEKIQVPSEFYPEVQTLHLDYSFPDAEKLGRFDGAAISEATHAGYRCDYIEKSCKRHIEVENQSKMLFNMTCDEAFRFVSGYTGVGPKVADCILLFTGAKDEAFPVDVWVKRVMQSMYGISYGNINKIREFGREYFGHHAGIAQEYLFSYIRKNNNITI